MKNSLLMFFMFGFLVVPLFSISKSDMKMKDGKLPVMPKMNDRVFETKTPYSGQISGYFDKSPTGYGWYLGYNRKISLNSDPVTGPMLGSIYRKTYPAVGDGAIGGMIGDWSGANLLSSTQLLNEISFNWFIPQDPGGRFPFSCGFINGYHFGIFNDMNLTVVDSTDSYPMFAIGDATGGYDTATWDIGLTAAIEGGATVLGAWTGTGDVVYDPISGYYYWSQAWNQNLKSMEDYIVGSVVGRSLTPEDVASWQWTDYRDLTFNCQDDSNGQIRMNELQWAYCKDVYGNGTGYGIAVTMANDVDDRIFMDSLDIDHSPRISYMYTTNWGVDDLSGDLIPNWRRDYSQGDVRLFQINPAELFDWYGTTFTEVDSISGDSTITVLNDPFITWNISSVATEYNAVHLLIKVFGGTSELGKNDDLFYINDDDYVAGYYHVRGLITDSGVIWSKANFIASFIGLDTGDIEYLYSNMNVLSIGYAGFGQIYGTWLDRPNTRPTLNEWP
ncbi:MAG: hypothetical protein GQ534_09080, partial [Candidatus Delongbacteria bacterium]|nr:hypothetical protein [Candidatus Delongbacteria bacterium]